MKNQDLMKTHKSIAIYLKYMENIKSASPHTLRHYAIDLDQIFGNSNHVKNINKEGKVFLESFENDLIPFVRRAFERTWPALSVASRNRKAATVKSFFSWLFEEKMISKDLSLQITCPKIPKKIPHFISVDEIISIVHFLRSNNEPITESLFFLIYGCGLRVSEACHLKWEAISLSHRHIRVLGKGNKERIVIAPRPTIAAVTRLKKMNFSDEYIFGQSPLNPRTAYEHIRTLGKNTGLMKPLHPHALRHSFATHLLSSGANLRTLQEILGHESLQATEKYTHLGIDQLARTLEGFHPLGVRKS